MQLFFLFFLGTGCASSSTTKKSLKNYYRQQTALLEGGATTNTSVLTEKDAFLNDKRQFMSLLSDFGHAIELKLAKKKKNKKNYTAELTQAAQFAHNTSNQPMASALLGLSAIEQMIKSQPAQADLYKMQYISLAMVDFDKNWPDNFPPSSSSLFLLYTEYKKQVLEVLLDK